jgi:hypothetical protein
VLLCVSTACDGAPPPHATAQGPGVPRAGRQSIAASVAAYDGLLHALEATRSSGIRACQLAAVCYRSLQEEFWCNYPTPGGEAEGFERNWPDPRADSCWQPLYLAHRREVLAVLACEQDYNRGFARCVAGCPTAEALGACLAKLGDANDACSSGPSSAIGPSALAAFDDCTDRLAPEPP